MFDILTNNLIIFEYLILLFFPLLLGTRRTLNLIKRTNFKRQNFVIMLQIYVNLI